MHSAFCTWIMLLLRFSWKPTRCAIVNIVICCSDHDSCCGAGLTQIIAYVEGKEKVGGREED